jgi:hypothetical protein
MWELVPAFTDVGGSYKAAFLGCFLGLQGGACIFMSVYFDDANVHGSP